MRERAEAVALELVQPGGIVERFTEPAQWQRGETRHGRSVREALPRIERPRETRMADVIDIEGVGSQLVKERARGRSATHARVTTRSEILEVVNRVVGVATAARMAERVRAGVVQLNLPQWS